MDNGGQLHPLAAIPTEKEIPLLIGISCKRCAGPYNRTLNLELQEVT